MKVQGRTKTSARARLAMLTLALCASVAAPAMGQAQGTSCVQQTLECASGGLDGGTCSSYASCFVSATESLYYSVDGRRFDCAGLDCAAAQQQLNDYCCPTPAADAGAGGPVLYSDGCALGRSGASAGALALLVLTGLLGARRRRSA